MSLASSQPNDQRYAWEESRTYGPDGSGIRCQMTVHAACDILEEVLAEYQMQG